MYGFYIGLSVVVLVLLFVVVNAIKVLREYQRGVIFTLGRYTSVKGPGLIFVIPIMQQMVRVDLRIVTMDVPSQDGLSRDNAAAKVNAVIYFRVMEPHEAISAVERYLDATSR